MKQNGKYLDRLLSYIKKKKGEQSGFTLVELIIVIAIIGVLVAMGTYYYSKYVEDARMAKAREVAEGLYVATTKFYSDVGRYPDSCKELTLETAVTPTDATIFGEKVGPWLSECPRIAGEDSGISKSAPASTDVVYTILVNGAKSTATSHTSITDPQKKYDLDIQYYFEATKNTCLYKAGTCTKSS